MVNEAILVDRVAFIQVGLMVVLSRLLAAIGYAKSEPMRDDVVPTVCDFEGYEYRTVQIGDQV